MEAPKRRWVGQGGKRPPTAGDPEVPQWRAWGYQEEGGRRTFAKITVVALCVRNSCRGGGLGSRSLELDLFKSNGVPFRWL